MQCNRSRSSFWLHSPQNEYTEFKRRAEHSCINNSSFAPLSCRLFAPLRPPPILPLHGKLRNELTNSTNGLEVGSEGCVTPKPSP
eukprot:755403-Hanusia_phi.AAC.1